MVIFTISTFVILLYLLFDNNSTTLFVIFVKQILISDAHIFFKDWAIID